MSEIDPGSLQGLLEGGPSASAASLEQVVSRRDRHARRRMRSLAVLALAVALGVAGGVVGRLDSGTVPAAAARSERLAPAMTAPRAAASAASAASGFALSKATLARPPAPRAAPGCAGPACGLGPLRLHRAQRGPISVRVFLAPRAALTWRERGGSCRVRGAVVAEWSDAGAASTTVVPLASHGGALRAVALGRLSVDPSGEAETVLVETGPRVVAVAVRFSDGSLRRARPADGLSALSSPAPLGGALRLSLQGADGPLGTVRLTGSPRVLLDSSCRGGVGS
ncbi:MAG: hypothetical protein M0004_17350 [Actinomycetota bacterium]|nr:hypothetical protein [Actinomycetota bacterium]